MIHPTIGRKVWYWPNGEGVNHSSGQAYDATVVYVYTQGLVNLVVRDHQGNQFPKLCVTLAQDREAQPGECEWMPYQKAQAAKHDADKKEGV